MSQPQIPPAQSDPQPQGSPAMSHYPQPMGLPQAPEMPPAGSPQPVGAPPPPPPLPPLPAAYPPIYPYPLPPPAGPAQPAPPPRPPAPTDQRPLFWRLVRAPFKWLLKGIYYTGNVVGKHRWLTVGMLAAVALMFFVLSTFTHVLAPRQANTSPAAGQTAGANTPFTISDYTSGLEPLPPSVINYLHGLKTYNADELWSAFGPKLQTALGQNGITKDQYVQFFAQEKAAGVSYDQFIYTSNFIIPSSGTEEITVEVIKAQAGQLVAQTFYFVVDGQSGLITRATNLDANATSGN